MGKYIAVKGCELELNPPSNPPATVTISTPESTSVKADGKGCYFGTLSVVISSYTGGAIDVPGTGGGSGTISGTSAKVSSNSLKAVLEGDFGVIQVNGSKQAGTTVTPVTVPVTVTIKSAGQQKVSAT